MIAADLCSYLTVNLRVPYFKMTSAKFNKNFLHMDVLFVKRYLDFTLAGIGSDLFVYSNDGSLLMLLQIFTGERIHNICIKSNLILLKGGRQLGLVKFKQNLNDWKCEIVSKMQCCDWVKDFVMLENSIVGLVTAHNFFECWDLELGKKLKSGSCEEKCILYSCKIIGDTLDTLVIFAGTVFGDVVIWTPFFKDNPTLQRLKGHNGAVFSIEVKPHQKLLTTTSDDRSLKVWSIISPTPVTNPTDWKFSSIQLLHTLFGHTARVWRSLILKSYYLTIGEDSQLIVWNHGGRMIKALCLHQESGIRALDYSDELNIVTTGGEDGGINAFSLKHLISQNEGREILNLGVNSSTRVCYTQNGVVYSLNGSCVLASKEGEEVVYKSENFSSYCLLEVSTKGEYIIMGSIKGFLVIINSNEKVVVVEEQILRGRVYSIHWLGPVVVTCGPEGKLDLWELSKEGLKNRGTKVLPNSKERWTTCGLILNENLILGDRMGNVHIYELRGGENPLKSFRKIHSHLGVSDVASNEGGWISIGRDGTIKEFTCDLNLSITCKLPMEWPWKIVRYEKDVLILGFRSVTFIVWSMKRREIIASHNCGGGHRSCDYKIIKNKLSFLYVKERKVFVADLILDEITRIRNGFHGKEINCLKILQTEPTVIVSGSEDTTLRLSRIEKSELKHVEVLKAHISSVRGVCAYPAGSKLLVVSVGGKGQMIVWDFDLSTLKCQELVNHRLREETRNWKSSTPSVDPEMRIMCADILKVKDDFIIVAGCSDRQIRVFSHGREFKELCAVPYTHCVLNVCFLDVDSMRMFVSMATDGKVVFWNTTDLCDVKQLEEFPLHQSGVNSFQFEEIESGKYILATGGDDNLISVAFVEVGEGKIHLRRVWESRTTHACQISGIKILRNFLITTSIDQRITMWKWSWHEDKFEAEFLNQYLMAVPDIQGMDAAWLSSSAILVAVHGKGIEIYNVNINQENS